MSTLFAYIDPGTGQLVLQVLAMTFMSMILFFQSVKAYVIGFFGVKRSAKVDTESQEVQTIKLEESLQESEQKAA